MTYRELQKLINTFQTEQLDCDVTLYNSFDDEFYGVHSLHFADIDNDVLDTGHPYLSFDENK